MGLSFGTIQVHEELTAQREKLLPAGASRVVCGGWTSLCDRRWENPALLDAAALRLFKTLAGTPAFAVCCFDEDHVMLMLYRDGVRTAECGAEALDVAETPPAQPEVFAEMSGLEDAAGERLAGLMRRTCGADAVLSGLEAFFGLRLNETVQTALKSPPAAAAEAAGKRGGDRTAALNQNAGDLFEVRMQALGVTTFKYHRWYKLIRDEVLLSLGLAPISGGAYALLLRIQPLFVGDVPHDASDNCAEDPYVPNADHTCRGMKYPYIPGICSYSWFPRLFLDGHEGDDWGQKGDRASDSPDPKRRRRFQSASLDDLSCYRIPDIYSRQLGNCSLQEGSPPIVANDRIPFAPGEFAPYCFFRMYDDCPRRLGIFYAAHWGYEAQRFAYPGFETALQKMGEREDQPQQSILLKNRAYDEIDALLHERYEKTLRTIKRRLKLEPDGSDTIWDRDYRRPIDVRQMLQERFDRYAHASHREIIASTISEADSAPARRCPLRRVDSPAGELYNINILYYF